MAATTWGLGDYPSMAERLMPVAREAVALARVNADDRVLDLACGTGNGASVAAARGAHAVGVDFEPALLDIARERVPQAEFRVADATALPFPDAHFTATLSVFGVMYAPDHEAAARELARVTAPGGRIVLAAWTPGSFMPRMGQALAPYLPPPPPGSGPPSRWGDEQQLTDLLGIPLETAERRTLTLDEDADFFIATAGHVTAERDRLEQERRWHDVRDELQALVGAPPVELEYLLASATRPGRAAAEPPR
jgi:SAM-dependent methyltransferase